MIALKKKKFMPFPLRPISREVRQAELRDMLERYKVLSTDPGFSRACRRIDRQDIKRGDNIEDRSFSEAVVAFYLKWYVYPIPEQLVNDHNFRASLEQLYLRQGRIKWIPVSPLTSKDEVVAYYHQLRRDSEAPKKLPNLRALRIALIYDHLVVSSAFHAFKASDFAAAMGSKPKTRKGGPRLSGRETGQADRLLQELIGQGTPYLAAEAKATRAVRKKRWREGQLTPKIRMATKRSLSTFKNLIAKPNK